MPETALDRHGKPRRTGGPHFAASALRPPGCVELGAVRLKSLTMVRHGESTGNAALAAALRAGAEEFASGTRDADFPLSDLGRAEAAALGTWLARHPQPDLIGCSPYLRARETADIALREPDWPQPRLDERLRDREKGILQGHTASGVRTRFPAEHHERERVGKFYYRPPGGESWPDVALRIRSLLPELHGHALIFTHDLVIVMTRYILGDLTEAEILDIESDQLRNCSVSRWEQDGSTMRLVGYNETEHLPAP
ncbi:histidine phosphatase family protein [Nocardia uniformis]|uniref:phosphoglycerate mutase (2,3-diphosphoglycerate-dependent) n=2 Tax=Nocardia uniformis TaxID=53432 RepID=A0A849C7Z5_9NOCA|nr:histidine phosphatase family protein [Nocardia uniformis]